MKNGISEQKKLERIKESEQKFRALVEQSLEGIALLSVDGTIRFCNLAFARLFGYYTINEIEKKNFLKFIPVETLESERNWLREDLNLKSEPGIRLIKAMKKDGIIFDLEYSFRIVDDPVARTSLIHMVARDVSARIDFENRRARFIEITSHELRTPLAIISGYVELLNDQFDKIDEKTKNEYFNILQQNIERLANLIDDVRTLGKIERDVFQLEKEEVNIYDFLGEIILTKKKLLPAQLEFYIHPEGAIETLIEADTSRLTQVLDNLFDNAIKHTPIDNKKIVVRLDVSSNGVKIDVTDNGAGIVAKDLERIFDPFISIPSRYYAQGTGIGLFISRSIVEAHGGTLTAYSEGKDKGTTFTLTLPRKKPS
ncbi:MAG: ATP-binding protein [Promethearchaeota archaeon]